MRATRGSWAPDLRRSLSLLRAFRSEQSDPAGFYGTLAADSVQQLSQYVDLAGRTVLDVGGGPGYFRDAFVAAGARYVGLDNDPGELRASDAVAAGSVVGDGMRLPVADCSVDVCYSSNVLEHVPRPWRMADEMVRVTRPGGVVFLSYTLWFGPWGGHETAPWHYLGGRRARDHYRRTRGREPKNRYGESLFPVTLAAGRAWAARQGRAEVVAVVPRYNPRGSYWLSRVPGLREVVTWNVAIVLVKG